MTRKKNKIYKSSDSTMMLSDLTLNPLSRPWIVKYQGRVMCVDSSELNDDMELISADLQQYCIINCIAINDVRDTSFYLEEVDLLKQQKIKKLLKKRKKSLFGVLFT
jgi:hypothetical protein